MTENYQSSKVTVRLLKARHTSSRNYLVIMMTFDPSWLARMPVSPYLLCDELLKRYIIGEHRLRLWEEEGEGDTCRMREEERETEKWEGRVEREGAGD